MLIYWRVNSAPGFALWWQRRAVMDYLLMMLSNGLNCQKTLVGVTSDFASVEGLELIAESLSPTMTVAEHELSGAASLLWWRAKAPGSFVLETHSDPLDIEREANGHLSLSLLLKVDQSPASTFWAGMQDNNGQTARLALNPVLNATGEW